MSSPLRRRPAALAALTAGVLAAARLATASGTAWAWRSPPGQRVPGRTGRRGRITPSCGRWQPSHRARSSAALRHAAEEGGAEEAVAGQGLFTAVTKIRLRTAPDVASAPTGKTVKQGEVFEITEVVKSNGPDSPSYLKVGERGWVFDQGISGEWMGKAIVEAVPEKDVASFREFLSDPVRYAEYQELLADPEKLGGLLKEQHGRYMEQGQQLRGDLGEVEDQELLADMQKAVKEQLSEEDQKQLMDVVAKATATLDPAAQEGEQPKEPESMVAPRWMKLEGTDWEQEARKSQEQEEEPVQLVRPVVNELPGGEPAMRRRPTCSGWRMGIRVPSVCSPL